MFKITSNSIQITRGDTGIFTLALTSAGQPYDYSNDEVLFTVKRNTNTTEIVFQKTVLYGENVTIEPQDTATLPYGNYVFDVQVTSGAVVDTVIPPSTFSVLPEVTFGGDQDG